MYQYQPSYNLNNKNNIIYVRHHDCLYCLILKLDAIQFSLGLMYTGLCHGPTGAYKERLGLGEPQTTRQDTVAAP